MEVLFSVPTPPAAANKPASQDATGKKPGEAAPKPAVAKPDADGLEQCLRDWDRGTHMTRQEWARTCRRVSANRSKFMREQPEK
jgi:hypothetical protein